MKRLLIVLACGGIAGCDVNKTPVKPAVAAIPSHESWLIKANQSVEHSLEVPIFLVNSLWASWSLTAFTISPSGFQGPQLMATNRLPWKDNAATK